VSYLRAFRSGIVLLVALSVSWKISIHRTASDDSIEHLTAFLAKNNYVVATPEQLFNINSTTEGALIIRATANGCDLTVARLNVDGSDRQLIESKLTGADDYFFVFIGQIYSARPELAVLTNYYWSRLLSGLGSVRKPPPLIAVASNKSCNAEQLPWKDLYW
jgi:hypothetical protein